MTVAKLKRRFGVEVNLKLPRIPYRETITASTEAHGRHKKQTGGHGQFGDCKVKFEPLPRGSDFEFVDDIFGGSIPRQFVPAVEKGIQDARLRGFLAGYPMVDFRATVFDGSFHPVDSNELSFKMAASLAFKDGMSRARPTLLEPIMNVEVYAPSDFAGDLMGDLNSRRGRIGGMDTRGTLDGHPRQGADVGDAHLRAAPHVSDRRPRLVSHGVLALRGGAGAPARQDHRARRRRSAGLERRRKCSRVQVTVAVIRQKLQRAQKQPDVFASLRLAGLTGTCAYEPPALRGVEVFAPLPRVSVLPPLPPLARAGLAFFARRAFGASAFFAFGLGLAAQALRRRAQAAADALRLRPAPCLGLLGLGVRVVLAADQLDLRDLGAVAAAVAEPQDARVAARPLREARRDRVEQLADDVAVLDVAQRRGGGRAARAAVGRRRRRGCAWRS